MPPRRCSPTAGSKLFTSWMQRQGFELRQAAALLSIDTSYVCRLRSGGRGPSLELAARIDRVTNGSVPVMSWCDRIAEAA